ncbi:hypothetical protein CRG98_007585, partial [Punica granatum]
KVDVGAEPENVPSNNLFNFGLRFEGSWDGCLPPSFASSASVCSPLHQIYVPQFTMPTRLKQNLDAEKVLSLRWFVSGLGEDFVEFIGQRTSDTSRVGSRSPIGGPSSRIDQDLEFEVSTPSPWSLASFVGACDFGGGVGVADRRSRPLPSPLAPHKF